MNKLKSKQTWAEPQVEFLPSLHGGAGPLHLLSLCLDHSLPRYPYAWLFPFCICYLLLQNKLPSKFTGLKQPTFIFTQFLWVTNPGVAGSGSGCRRRLQSEYWQRLHSSEDLTGAGGTTFYRAPSHGHWQEPSAPHWLLAEGVSSSLGWPLQRAA